LQGNLQADPESDEVLVGRKKSGRIENALTYPYEGRGAIVRAFTEIRDLKPPPHAAVKAGDD
jgi:hypothetical protein